MENQKNYVTFNMKSKLTSKRIISNELSILCHRSLSTVERKLVLAKKYFDLWRAVIQYKKRNKCLIERDKLFDEKIISFISDLNISSYMSRKNAIGSSDKLSEICKSNVSVNAKKSLCNEIYHNRFQAQKYIINNQKALIEEQNNIISCLKYNISKHDNHLAIHQEDSNTSSKSPEKTKLLPKPFVHPLVQRMEEREEGRKNRWSLLTLRRKEKEKFLAQKLLEEEEERKRLEAKKRKIRIQEKREQERIMKEMEIKKKREQEICNELSVRVNSFYKRLLCVKTLKMWKGYLKYLEYLQKRCSYVYDISILKNSLLAWSYQVDFTKDLLHRHATRLDETYILINGWYQWKRKINAINRRRRKMTIWRDKEITRNIFKKWLMATYKSINNKEFMLQYIVIIYERLLLLKTFGLWKQLPQILYFEREKEKRLREWESSVKSILPDYNMQLH